MGRPLQPLNGMTGGLPTSPHTPGPIYVTWRCWGVLRTIRPSRRSRRERRDPVLPQRGRERAKRAPWPWEAARSGQGVAVTQLKRRLKNYTNSCKDNNNRFWNNLWCSSFTMCILISPFAPRDINRQKSCLFVFLRRRRLVGPQVHVGPWACAHKAHWVIWPCPERSTPATPPKAAVLILSLNFWRRTNGTCFVSRSAALIFYSRGVWEVFSHSFLWGHFQFWLSYCSSIYAARKTALSAILLVSFSAFSAF